MYMYRLVASVGAEAPKSTIDPDGEILTVLGGKASCRRKFVLHVHLLDAHDAVVHEDFSIVASVAYAHDKSPIVNDENVFLAEPPLLTTFNGVEYPSQHRPTRLVSGKASFKLAISLLSSKYDNRLFCICFSPHYSPSSPHRKDGLGLDSCSSSSNIPVCDPCYSKPIRSISRKRSNSASTVSVSNNARPLPMTQHHHHHHHHQYAPGAKSKGPDRALTPIATSATTSADQEVDKFFKASVNSATSSSTDEQYDMKNTTTNSIYGREGDADSGSGSLCYIASNSFKQEAQLLEAIHIPPTYHNGPRHHENHSFIPAIEAEDFLATNQIHPCNHDYQCHMQHDDHGENDCFNVDPSFHMCDMVYDHHESLSDPSSISASADHDYKYNEGYSMDGNCSDTTQKNVLMMHAHTDYDGCCYMDSPSKLDVLINGRFTPPNTFMSGQSESSTSPLSGILTAATTTGLERPPSNPRPGSQLSSPFQPYNASIGAMKSGNFSKSPLIRSPSCVNSSWRESPDHGLFMVDNMPLNLDQYVGDGVLVNSHSKNSLDAIIQKFLREAITDNTSIEDEEQSLINLEMTLQRAITELERKKEQLYKKRRRVVVNDDPHMPHNIPFQSSAWIESLSNKFNF